MAKKTTDSRRIRDLPPEVRVEIERAKAKAAAEKVKMMDAKIALEEHQAQISRLKGDT